MKILIVKTTSMGDVVHAVPVIADIRKHFPEAKIDWLAEDVFADIPRLTKGVDEVLVCSVRKWKKSLLDSETRQQISALKSALRQKKYDLVIDLQGLIKSAVLASWTRAPVAGYDRSSIKEPLASFFYRSKLSVSRQLSAVERCRSLAALALGYEIPSDVPQFLFQFTEQKGEAPFVVFYCNSSRETKLWPEDHWIQLGRIISERGYRILLPWGSAAEKSRVERISQGVGSTASVLPRMSIGELMNKTSGAKAVVGLDTGMTHLSSAMGIPTVGIFRDYPIELVPLMGEAKKKALGGVGSCPSIQEAAEAFEEVLS